MMANEKKPAGDYEVGRGKPPKKYSWPKGQSGNLKGRPKSKKSGSADVAALLDAPIRVTTGGKKCDMSPFEAGFRQLAKRALAGDFRSILKFVRLCEEYGVIAPQPAPKGSGVIVAPKGVDFYEWLNSVTEEVPVDEE